jgi:hypothetical protein
VRRHEDESSSKYSIVSFQSRTESRFSVSNHSLFNGAILSILNIPNNIKAFIVGSDFASILSPFVVQ